MKMKIKLHSYPKQLGVQSQE